MNSIEYQDLVTYFNLPTNMVTGSKLILLIHHLLKCIHINGPDLLAEIINKGQYNTDLSSFLNGKCLDILTEMERNELLEKYRVNAYLYSDMSLNLTPYECINIKFHKFSKSKVTIDLYSFVKLQASLFGFKIPGYQQAVQYPLYIFIGYKNEKNDVNGAVNKIFIKRILIIDTITLITKVLNLDINQFYGILYSGGGNNFTIPYNINVIELLKAGAIQITDEDIKRKHSVYQILQRQKEHLVTNKGYNNLAKHHGVINKKTSLFEGVTQNAIFNMDSQINFRRWEIKNLFDRDSSEFEFFKYCLITNPELITSPLGRFIYDIINEYCHFVIDLNQLHPQIYVELDLHLPFKDELFFSFCADKPDNIIDQLDNYQLVIAAANCIANNVNNNSTDFTFNKYKEEMIKLMINYQSVLDNHKLQMTNGKPVPWTIILTYFALKDMCQRGICTIAITNLPDIKILNQYRGTDHGTQQNLLRSFKSYFKPPLDYKKKYITYIGI